MNDFGLSPLSGLPLVHEVGSLRRLRPIPGTNAPREEGAYAHYTGEPGGAWATSLDFAPDVNQMQARPIRQDAPLQIGELDLKPAELQKLKAYALSIAVQSRLKAQRFGGGKFPLFVSAKEQKALSDFEIETPYNFLPYAIEDLWKKAQALTIPEQANQTLVNLSLLEEINLEKAKQLEKKKGTKP